MDTPPDDSSPDPLAYFDALAFRRAGGVGFFGGFFAV
jgi:hypothetical protein